MLIDINTLEKAACAIFQHLREQEIHVVDVEEDFYWDIDLSQKYSPYEEPTDMSLGQLTDNWESIQQIASGESDAMGYALVWLAALCRYIGEKKPA